jgi:hypothetical protein
VTHTRHDIAAGDSHDATTAVLDDYKRRGAGHGARADDLRRQAIRLSQWRLLMFIAAAALGVMAYRSPVPMRYGWLVGVVACALAFVLLARRHAHRVRTAAWERERQRGCETGRARVRRDWASLPASPMAVEDSSHPYARDLDVTGDASLAQLLDTVSAAPGRDALARTLLDAATPQGTDPIAPRQEAARELVAAVEWRETLAAHARRMGDVKRSNAERFLEWCDGKHETRVSAPYVRVVAVLLPILTIVLLSVWSAGDGAARPWWLASVGATLLLVRLLRTDLASPMRVVASRASGLASHARMFKHVEEADFTSAALRAIHDRLHGGGGINERPDPGGSDGGGGIKQRPDRGDPGGRSAAESLATLQRIARWSEVRYSPMAHALLQALLAWDVHVGAWLEKWQRESGSHARDWFAALGEVEVIAALATLAYENPAWAWPEVTDNTAADAATQFDATGLGHPLIAPGTRVVNDVTLGPGGAFLLVTGSNMSGKTTLLRAIGLNAVLAMAGGPVCASRLRLPRLRLWTSVRIEDSLERGMSLFRAELERIRQVVEAAREAHGERPFLFLLDEILHGTNSAERRIAARTVLRHLMRAGAFGAITTHDLELAEDDALREAATPVHFTESFERDGDGRERMVFDYRLRPGVATSANALRLLAMAGLGDEALPDQPPAGAGS